MTKITSTGLLNPEQRTPAVFLMYDGKAHLFDCGRARYTMDFVNRLRQIYISHTHMDHFSQFDDILGLKVNGASNFLTVFGPEGITDSVRHKIKAYTWNLQRPTPLVITVNEVLEGLRTQTLISIPDNLDGVCSNLEVLDGDKIWKDKSCNVRFVELNHKISSFGYVFEEHSTYTFLDGALQDLGVKPGQWIAELKQRALEGLTDDLFIDGKRIPFSTLQKALFEKKGMKIAYLTDFLLDDKTLEKLVALAGNSDVLYCESKYTAQDKELARKHHHLTSEQAAEIAKACNVGRLVIFHHSERYPIHQMRDEAVKIFKNVA